MAKATHNGICQICGSEQAVNPKTGLIAAHGYAVMYHQQHNKCHGGKQLPLQVETELARQYVEFLQDEIESYQDELEQGVEEVAISVPVPGTRIFQAKMVGREEWEAQNQQIGWRWENAVECRRKDLVRWTALNEHWIDGVEERINRYHGDALIERKKAA